MNEYKKALPEINGWWHREYWAACKKRQLLIQKCKDCGKVSMNSIRMLCPHCLSGNLGWIPASGRGKIYSFSTILAYPPKAFSEDLPYVIAVIELAEGPRMRSNIVGCRPEEIKCDMDVEVVFEDITDEYALPKFKPAARP